MAETYGTGTYSTRSEPEQRTFAEQDELLASVDCKPSNLSRILKNPPDANIRRKKVHEVQENLLAVSSDLSSE